MNNRAISSSLSFCSALLCAAALWAMSGVSSAANLIINADFSAGATGFTSAYTNQTAVAGDTALYGAGTYAITSDPRLKHTEAASYFDHTSGNASGAMMAVNGAGVAGAVVWQQVVTVTPNTIYDFSAWLSSWISASPATMNFTVNGSTIGSLAANGGTQWVEFVSTWNSGASTTATIRIVNTNTSEGGNDFALDDLYFGIQLPRLTSVSPNSGTTAGGTAVTLTGTGFTGATNVTFGGTAATNRVVVNSTTITCTTPARAAGTASVVVTTPAGTNAANTLFTYVAPASAGLILSINTSDQTYSLSGSDTGSFAQSGENFTASWRVSGLGGGGPANILRADNMWSSSTGTPLEGTLKSLNIQVDSQSGGLVWLFLRHAGVGPTTVTGLGVSASYASLSAANKVTFEAANGMSLPLLQGSGFGAINAVPAPSSSATLTTAAYTGSNPTLNQGVLYNFPIVSDSQAAPATLTITSTSAGTVLNGTNAAIGNNINTGFRTNVNLTLNPGESVVAQTISLTTGQFDDGLRLDYNGLTVLDFDFSNYNIPAVDSMFGGAWTPWTNEGSPTMELDADGLRLMVTAVTNGTGTAAGILAGQRINVLNYFTADAYVRNPVNPDFVSGVQIGLYSRNNQGPWAISNATMTATARLIQNSPTGLASLATGTGQQINTTWFRDAQNGFIGTDGGGVRVTNNGGQTWTTSNTGVTNNIHAIREVDGVLFLAGANGLICRSTNNGATWTTQATGTTATFHSLAFSSATRGFAVGTGGTICIYNGTTWTAQTTGTTANFNGVSIVGNTAWAVGSGGVICRYNGTSWVQVNSGAIGTFYDVSFLRDNLGFAVGANGLLCRYNGTVWQQVSTDVNITWRSVFVADENTIVISGAGGLICQSTDGGQTWQTLSVGSSAVLTTVGVAGGQVRVFGAGGAGYAFTVRVATGLVNLNTGTDQRINTTWFSDAQNGFIGTDRGGVRVTINGGQTWTTSNTGVTSNINAIRKVGGVLFLAGANGVICRSTDNGATWTAQTTGTTATFRALAFSSTTSGFAVGTGGTICIYNGTTWVAQSSGTTADLTGVSIVGNTAWAVGAGGVICFYNGTSWSTVNSGVTVPFSSVSFLRANLGYAVGAGGLICRYNGTTWVQVTSGVTAVLRSVVVVNASTIVVSGDGGLILQSIDGGVTWQLLTVGSSGVLTSLAVEDGQVRVFGDGGAGYSFSISPPPPSAAEGVITTVAGTGTSGSAGDQGQATSAQLNQPFGTVVDLAGNLYIADEFNHRVRKVTPSGVISTIAGDGTAAFGGDGGAATAAKLNRPTGLAFDASGNLYIADRLNSRIRMVNTSGVISTVAGTTFGFSGDGGQATSAQLNAPTDVAFAPSGELYIADGNNHKIRKVNASGIISTVAGTTQGFSGDGGQATAAQFRFPLCIDFDSSGSLFISDNTNHRIRKVNASGVITTVVGTTQGFLGDGGQATAARLNFPLGITIDGADNIFIADAANSRIRKVDNSGVITTVAGNGTSGFSGDGGPATSAQLNGVFDVTLDAVGNFYIADTSNNRIRKVWSLGVPSDQPTALTTLNTGTTRRINTTWFRDTWNGFIGTDGGGVRVTSDGGQTWTASTTGVSNDIYAIRQVGTVLFLAGANGLICRSTDNGATWTAQTTGTSATFRALAFSSTTSGFAVGTGGTICIYNGTSWTAQSSGTTADFTGVTIVGNTAWAVGTGGVICRYNGTSWVPVSSGETRDFNSVSFLRENLGFAVGANGLLCRYNGTSWVAVNTGVTTPWRSVVVADDSTIVISGDGGLICQSTDGGVTWQTLTVGSSGVLTSLAVVEGRVVVVGGGGAAYAFSVRLPTDLADVETGTQERINAASFSDELNGFIATNNGGVRRTIDGGLTWTTSNTGVTSNINAIRAVGGVAFLAGANGVICRYNGTTWVAQATGTNATFRALAFSSATSGFAVGTGGTICIYNGTTWVAQNTGTTADFYGVEVVGTTAWAVGTGGVICFYNGTSWATVNSGVTASFYAVDFLRANFGFAVGADGVICRYNGTSWVAVNSGVTTAFRSVLIVDDNTIVVSGDGGLVCLSTDGGLTWQTLSVGTSASLTTLALAGDEVLAFGDGGTGFAFFVSPPPLTPFSITAFSYNPTARTVNLTFLSEPGINYTIETSFNGQTWTVLGAPVPGAAGATSTTVTGRPLQPPYTDRLLLRVRH
jgi:photosystem II stability/assembly factor-like uncharacterized protein